MKFFRHLILSYVLLCVPYAYAVDWIDDLLIIVVVDGLIIKETIMNVIDEKGNLISDKYGYTDYPILYANFKEAKMIYQNKKNNE